MMDSIKHFAVFLVTVLSLVVVIIFLSKIVNSSDQNEHHEVLEAPQTHKMDEEKNKKEQIIPREEEKIAQKFATFKFKFTEEFKNLQEKIIQMSHDMEVLSNQSKTRLLYNIQLNATVSDLKEKLEVLNKTLLWSIENDYKKRELDAAQKEEDKQFPFDPQHNGCYDEFYSKINSTQNNNTASGMAPIKLENGIINENVNSTCVLILRRSFQNSPRVEGQVHLNTINDKYRISVAGTVPPISNGFAINIYADEDGHKNILHVRPRLDMRKIVLNTHFSARAWHSTQIYGPLNGISEGKHFKIVITFEDSIFKIVVNEREPILFHNRFQDVSVLRRVKIDYPVNIRLLTFEILTDPKSTLISEEFTCDNVPEEDEMMDAEEYE